MKKILLIAVLLFVTGFMAGEEIPECDLMKAVLSGSKDDIRRAISNGADVNAYVIVFLAYGKPLSEYSVHEFDDKYKGAMADGVELWKPLNGAYELRDPDILRLLVEAGADVNFNGGKLLFQAISYEREELLPPLLEATLNEESRAAAWNAVFRESGERDVLHIVEMLLDAGFDPNGIVKNGKTILQTACGYGCGEGIIGLLKSRGAEFSYESPLLGTWLYPAMNSVPGAPGKMVYLDDGTGLIYDRSGDTDLLKRFTYEFMLKDDKNSLYRIIQTYAPDDRWYALVYVQDMGDINMLYWMAWGQNIEVFPEWGESASVVWNGVSADEVRKE